MVSVGVIAEGVTDHEIIESILIGHFDGDEDKLNYLQLQPVTDTTDNSSQNIQGGWGHVINYCKAEEKLRKNLTDLNFIIIQIDSDIISNIGIDRSGQETIADLYITISNKLIELIGNNVYSKFHEKIIFAIGIEMSECWLLPYHIEDEKKAKKTVGCISTLNNTIKTSLGFYIDEASKDINYYQKLCKPLLKAKTLKRNITKNESLNIFYKYISSKLIV